VVLVISIINVPRMDTLPICQNGSVGIRVRQVISQERTVGSRIGILFKDARVSKVVAQP
jgi:hypothetical protein